MENVRPGLHAQVMIPVTLRSSAGQSAGRTVTQEGRRPGSACGPGELGVPRGGVLGTRWDTRLARWPSTLTGTTVHVASLFPEKHFLEFGPN